MILVVSGQSREEFNLSIQFDILKHYKLRRIAAHCFPRLSEMQRENYRCVEARAAPRTAFEHAAVGD
jgi:hypothetical protein